MVMIKLFTGLPGAGKTYRAVYELQKVHNEYYVLHNIDGLREDKFDEGKYISRFPENEKEFRDFFSLENQKRLHEESKDKYGRPLLIIIDECQIYLGKVNEGIKAWLSYHRHLGQDVWLITQDKYNIAREYNNLVEIEVQGKRGYVFKSFIYSYFSKGERVKTDKLPKDINVFNLYRSMTMDEVKKPKSKLMLFALICGGLALGFGIFYIFVMLPKGFKDEKAIKKEIKQVKSVNDQSRGSLRNESYDAEYSYVGLIKGQAVFVDSGLNVWLQNELYDGSTLLKNAQDGKIVLVDKDKGPINLKMSSIRRNSAASGARSAPGGGAVLGGEREASSMSGKWVKVVVNIR